MVGSTSEMDSGHENKKIGLYPLSTTIFKDFMRCQLFRYIHAEGASSVLREDTFVGLALLAKMISLCVKSAK